MQTDAGRGWLVGVLGLAVGGFALWWLQSVQPRAAAAPAAAPAAAVAAAPHRVDVTLVDAAIQGADTVTVRQGEAVEIALASDRAIVLHLHGYEVTTQVEPRQPALMAFKAAMPGRFPVHEHREGAGNHRAVFFVEVHP